MQPPDPKPGYVHHESTLNATHPHLMDLAIERRTMILTHLLGYRIVSLHTDGQVLRYRSWPRYRVPAAANGNGLAILRTSRQLEREAMCVLSDCTTFFIQIASSKPSTLYQPLLCPLPIPMVRRAILPFDLTGCADWENVRRALSMFNNLEILDLHFDCGDPGFFVEAGAGGIFQPFWTDKTVHVRRASCIGSRSITIGDVMIIKPSHKIKR